MNEPEPKTQSGQLWLHAPGQGQRAVVVPDEGLVVGRDPDCDLSLDDGTVSSEHLELEWRGAALMASDLDSSNGTLLNGKRLHQARRLRDGDVLQVGSHRLEVRLPTVRAKTISAGQIEVELTAHERAVAKALVTPLRVQGAVAARPATQAAIADEVGLSEKSVQRCVKTLAQKLRVPPSAGQDRPRQVAARILELGLDR